MNQKEFCKTTKQDLFIVTCFLFTRNRHLFSLHKNSNNGTSLEARRDSCCDLKQDNTFQPIDLTYVQGLVHQHRSSCIATMQYPYHSHLLWHQHY